MLIENVLPRQGATLLYGLQKSGKSLFAAQTAVSVATGKALFDYYRVLQPGGVLVLQQDDPGGIGSFKQIMLAAKVTPDTPIIFVPKDKWFFLGPDMMAWLEEQITEENLKLVVLDSYTALRSNHPPGVDIVKHENSEMTQLDELGKRLHCLILLLHHDSKGSSSLDWSSKAGGSYAITMATESQIYIARYPDLPNERLVRLMGRSLDSLEMTLRFQKETLNYEWVLEGAGALHYAFIRDIQTEFKGQPFTAKNLYLNLGLARATAYRWLLILLRAGAVYKTGDDQYRLADGIH
jgi:hypothetical protein